MCVHSKIWYCAPAVTFFEHICVIISLPLAIIIPRKNIVIKVVHGYTWGLHSTWCTVILVSIHYNVYCLNQMYFAL